MAEQRDTDNSPSSRNKVLVKSLLGALILAGFVAFVEAFIGWRTLLQPWRELQTAPLAGAIILVFVSYGLRALRVYDYFHREMRGRFALCLRLSLQHNMLNNLLPMRTGELSFPLLMSRYFSIAPTRSLPTLFWFRLLDLHALLTLGLLVAGSAWLGTTASLIVTLLWLPLPWLAFRLYQPWLGAVGARRGRLWSLLRHILHSLPQQAGHFWRSWLWTLLNWIIKLAIFAWVLGLFVEIGFGAAWMGATAGDLTSVLPVHGVAGAGTYEAGVVAGLAPFRVAAADSLAAAVNLHLFVLGCTLLSGVLSLLLPRRSR